MNFCFTYLGLEQTIIYKAAVSSWIFLEPQDFDHCEDETLGSMFFKTVDKDFSSISYHLEVEARI